MRLTMTAGVLLTVVLTVSDEALAFRRRPGPGTPGAAEMHGMANIIRSQGRASRDYSRARINNEEARSKYIDNQQKWTAVYFEKKRMLESHKARESAKQRASRDAYLKTNPSAPPPRLTSSQLDSITGEIAWPAGLMISDFEKHRSKVESLFAVRSRTATTTVAADLRAEITGMRNTLKSQIKSMAPEEYMAARKFLESLAYEAAQPRR